MVLSFQIGYGVLVYIILAKLYQGGRTAAVARHVSFSQICYLFFVATCSLNAYNQCTAYNKTITRLERVLKFAASNLSQGESSNLDCKKMYVLRKI